MIPDLTIKSACITGALFFALLLPIESRADSLQPVSRQFEAGVSMLRFNYTEYNSSGNSCIGSVCDRELGGMPGLSFRFAKRESGWEVDASASYHRGQVGYNGQLNSGAPYSTRTNETISDVSLRLGHWLESAIPIMPYAGIGLRHWYRAIQSSNGIPGLNETYDWAYFWAGAAFAVSQHPASALILDIGWLRPLDPSLQVGSQVNLKPVSRDGMRLMLSARMHLAEQLALTVEPYYEYWELGRSPSVISGPYSYYEPDSKTRNLGLNLRLGVDF